ncbi:MAG TPA: DUF4097 family beta strand repeat-containing protein [Balneolaceae bacterium]|nr:DUF4097 family beta strand repeat-containing protein [Balneolaceae bacterium]
MTSRNSFILKAIIGIIFSLLVTFLLARPGLAVPSQDEPYKVKSFTVNTPGRLEVKTSGGYIKVKGSSTNTVRVEMYVRKNGHNLLPEDSKLDDWDIDISQSGQRVKAIAKHHGRGWHLFGGSHVSISFVVYTPREMSSDLNTSGGHIEVRGLSGKQDISTSGGHLELAELKGTIDARTSGGHISVSDVQGNMDARTSGGHIDVQNSEGDLKVRTSGGHINLANVGGTIDASTSGGGISADLTSIAKSVNLRTSGGNINISVPGDTGLDLHLRGSYVSTKLRNFSGKVDRDEVDGELNGGGPEITARTSGGTVELSFK